jgi:hypothetical protein
VLLDPRFAVALEDDEELLGRELEPGVPLLPRDPGREAGDPHVLLGEALLELEHRGAALGARQRLHPPDLALGERELLAEHADRVPRDAVALLDAEVAEEARALRLRALEPREEVLEELAPDPGAERARLVLDDLADERAPPSAPRFARRGSRFSSSSRAGRGPRVAEPSRALDELLAVLLAHREEPLVAVRARAFCSGVKRSQRARGRERRGFRHGGGQALESGRRERERGEQEGDEEGAHEGHR